MLDVVLRFGLQKDLSELTLSCGGMRQDTAGFPDPQHPDRLHLTLDYGIGISGKVCMR